MLTIMENLYPTVSIILPSFNEETIIGNVVRKIYDVLTTDGQTFEILVMDYVLEVIKTLNQAAMS